jgi:hypothetical protein
MHHCQIRLLNLVHQLTTAILNALLVPPFRGGAIFAGTMAGRALYVLFMLLADWTYGRSSNAATSSSGGCGQPRIFGLRWNVVPESR